MLFGCPITLKEANRFVERHHRKLGPVQGGLFASAVATEADGIVGVGIVARPARNLQDGWTCAVVRLPVRTDVPARNACSFLYGALWRAARALGYRRMVTYIDDKETGVTLRAAGWRCVAEVKAQSWHRKNRPRVDKHEITTRFRWEKTA